jgi:HD-GYP domain-containing protein (c-di-GMP phosphodiesterase class II)
LAPQTIPRPGNRMIPEMRRVAQGDIRIGEPLPWSVFDPHGNLLLKQGFVINSEKHLQRLLASGLYHDSSRPASSRSVNASLWEKRAQKTTVFDMMEVAKARLGRVFEDLKQNIPTGFRGLIDDLAMVLQECCDQDPDSVLASLHLDYQTSYTVIHHLQAAVLCELVSRRLKVSESVRTVLMCAALTHDVGILDIQDELDSQTSPLADAQRLRVREHPLDSASILRRLGITEKIWLDVVQDHHERTDGTGYPLGKKHDGLLPPARILGIADMYSAMVRDRPYRKAMLSKDAMRDLLVEQGNKTDPLLIQHLIKEVGVFPPGTTVRLANNEVAVVKIRQGNRTCPIVYSFVRSDGMPLASPIRRDTAQSEFAIQGMVPFSNYKNFKALIFGVWAPSS